MNNYKSNGCVGNWEICRDIEKDYYYLCNNTDVYCSPDGEPYHFKTRTETEKFLNEVTK